MAIKQALMALYEKGNTHATMFNNLNNSRIGAKTLLDRVYNERTDWNLQFDSMKKELLVWFIKSVNRN